MNHVTKQLAIKLKQAGFDVPVRGYYHSTDGYSTYLFETVENMNGKNWAEGYCSAPDLHTVTDWLRERHGLHVVTCLRRLPLPNPYTTCKFMWGVQDVKNISELGTDNSMTPFTHSEALAAGIEHAVNEVLKRMNNGTKSN